MSFSFLNLSKQQAKDDLKKTVFKYKPKNEKHVIQNKAKTLFYIFIMQLVVWSEWKQQIFNSNSK